MEYPFELREIFPEEISVIEKDLIPKGCPGLNQLGASVVKERVSKILDTMGKASAEAQELHSIITNAEKLRTSDNKLYMFCDFVSNKAVGLLKIGKKKLFVFDEGGTQHELMPLCILDFYIHETRQRKGAGKYLFEYMLRDEGIPVQHYAIDRPSEKLIFFLRKHYGLLNVLPQVNNFVIFDGFFKNRSDYQGKKKKWSGLDQTDEIHHVAHAKDKVSRMEDSLAYNNEPLIHLRNGHQLPPHYMQRRHNSSIGEILQPTIGGQACANGNGHAHGHGPSNGQNGAPRTPPVIPPRHPFRPATSAAVNNNGWAKKASSIYGDVGDEAEDDLEYDKLRHQPRRLSRLNTLNDSDVEIHYDISVESMGTTEFRKLRNRSRSRDLDQGHASLW